MILQPLLKHVLAALIKEKKIMEQTCTKYFHEILCFLEVCTS